MHPMAHICALTALVSVLWASPVQVFERDEGVCPANSGFTAGDWCSGNLGNNVVMQVSDQKSDWGTVNPGDVVQSIRDRCLTGACNEFSWEFDSMYANPQRVEVTPGKVKVTLVDTILDKIHTGPMLDALQYTLDHLKDFRVDKIDPSYKCSAGICDNGHEADFEHTSAPATVVLQIREQDDATPLFERGIVSQLTLHVEQSSLGDGLTDGVCDMLVGIGSAVAGAVNPIFGAVGSLATLGCWLTS